MPNLKAKLHNFIHLARDIRSNANLAVNEELFWNQYVNDWEKSEKSKDVLYLGTEWKHEEDFLSLLQKYASSGKEALEIGWGAAELRPPGSSYSNMFTPQTFLNEMLRKCKEAITAANVSFHKLDGFTLKDFADGT